MKNTLILFFFLSLTGCTHNQSKALSMNSSPVNTYPQSMSNLQLCDTLYYGRSSNQTLAAIGSEFNRRGLSKHWCDTETNKLYLTKTIDWVADQVEDKEDSEEEASAVVLPAN
ncbi:hypothetical protein AB6D20_014585 [Vibrio splendidus]|jgi:hypothetical protein|uniref:hypothetical protein n=1 Tax=Vibrio TaxID=662 RepID=UPI000322E94C|nr:MULTISPECIES: hypothetical protein [Vibrio]TVU74741.1 hypothetical protein FQP87_12790 [Vibrio tasmaniensis]MCF7503631.1 hypothetical protein [Vibrio sp. L3-7]MDH5896650.1 hypothetical protein [Vibrio splendidus]MDH6018522.1 hypothetical protein [Vibrio splendidus]PTO60774.1 hypothetical protein CWN99_22270 [Vibrio splendidus]